MRHVLAATDLSALADLALDRAIGLAAATGARLTIASVDQPHDLAVVSPDLSLATVGEFEQSWSSYVDRELASRVARAQAAGLTAAAVRLDGRPDDAIAEAAEAHDVDLIVVGSAGRTGLKRLVLGSVAESIVHRARRPVLIARGAGGGRFTRVVVATDFGPPSLAALAAAREVAAPDAEVEAIYAWHYPAGSLGLAALGERTNATAALREALTQGPEHRGAALVAAEAAAGRSLGFALRHGPAHEVVVDAATDRGADLIAVGSHRAGGVRRLLLGSVSTQVMRHAPCSVLIVHA
ncbi:MAG: universal stress protein [Kofleriaceae bacterium]|jgi:nucleotide-binding universal stress UspA family protein|nr:universal stress protein [Kofleriaceae bacterium]MBP9167398.1 universal stress protein [Kofleriaceae bacterium]MBP9860722.1 universal stress protein [Kofleriaceae bacterium]